MAKQETIDLINSKIKANGNKEITGNILNGVLLSMINQINDLTGSLSDLTTADRTSLVAAINEVNQNIGQNEGIKVFQGTVNPNYLPPIAYSAADFFYQVDQSNNPIALWQYNGSRWYVVGGENSDTYLISVGLVSVAGNNVTYDSVKGYIEGVVYELSYPQTLNVPFAASGLTRKDKIVMNGNGVLVRVIGEETAGISIARPTPIRTVAVDILDVSDNAINSNPIEPEEPTAAGNLQSVLDQGSSAIILTDFVVKAPRFSFDGEVQLPALTEDLTATKAVVWDETTKTLGYAEKGSGDDSDTIARTIDVTLSQLGVAIESEVTFANIVTYFNSLGLSKPATEMYIVRIVESTEVEYDLDIEGDFESVGITDYTSWLEYTGVELSDFFISDGGIVGNFADETMTLLDLSEKGISKVSRITAVNLTELGLGNNQITEIKGLDNLVNLTFLDLSENGITEIKGLENLVNLAGLSISNNQITEIKGLENLVNLIVLYLDNNQLTEIKNLESLINLTDLDLDSNQLTEIKNLESLINLRNLGLSKNKLNEIKGLDNLINLSYLNLRDNLLNASSYISAMTWANSLSYKLRNFHFTGNLNLTSTEYLNLKAVLVSKNSNVIP